MELDSVDDLIEANPIKEDSVSEAAKQWADEPPIKEFANILEAQGAAD